MKKIYNQINVGIIFYLFFIVACGGGDDSEGLDPDPPVSGGNNPEAAMLTFPEMNSECTEGTNVSSTESTIAFSWKSAMYTDSYTLHVKNLTTGISSSYTSTTTSKSVKLKRNTPYSWFVNSNSTKTTKTATSTVWKFYNAGEGTVSYAPFPAEIASPILGTTIESGSISLDWTGSDIDNDIESYDVYFGEVNPPTLFETAVQESILNEVIVETGKTYFWKITTKDELGNISTSDIFNFKVD